MEKILFAKIKPTAIIPSKREEDGCYDLYACFDENETVIEPHTVKLIPTGLISAFSSKYRIAYRERGSNTKSNLEVMAGQIDSGYRGEYFVPLQNNNPFTVIISKDYKEVTKVIINEPFHKTTLYVPYSKAVCQFAIEEVPQVKVVEVTIDDVQAIPSERGMGMLGSSGK